MTTSNIDTQNDDRQQLFLEQALDRWNELERGWKATLIGLVLLSVRAVVVQPI